MIGIIDIRLGNLSSVKNSVDSLFFENIIIQDPEKISSCSHVILPGVGSYKQGMTKIKDLNFYKPLKKFVDSGKPLLGICLGMQLFFSFGNEFENIEGLNFISGSVKKLQVKNKFKLPHVGWNTLNKIKDHYIMSGINEGIDVYFVHSFHCLPNDLNNVIARTNYSENFVSIVAKDNIIGTQFHPEKSIPLGTKILKNFLMWDGNC